MKLLIVDDDKEFTSMLSRFLTVKGFDSIVTNDGRNALDLIKKEKYDTIFLDLAMPDFGGNDVIAALEKENLLKDQRIVILTAISISNEEIDALLEKDSIEFCLRKPVELSKLMDTIPMEN